MRKNLTFAERRLFERIKAAREMPKFLSQQVIYPYIVDFVCIERMIVIEIDGASHENTQASDDLRDSDLKKAGYAVLRFTNAEVTLSLDTVMERIKFECSINETSNKVQIQKKSSRTAPRKMVIPLPRVVYEEPYRKPFKTRAGKVRIRRALAPGETIRAICAICNNPIADADIRVRHKESADILQWVHKSCLP